MDPSLTQMCKQYFQQLNDLCYPSPQVLLNPYIQDQIFHYMFDGSRDLHLPPANYQRRVLKYIIDKVESAIQDPNEDEVSDKLMERIAYLSTLNQLPLAEAAQQKTVVSYHLPQDPESGISHPILIEEARNLLALGNNLGFRTWDPCLRLAYYLSTSGQSLIKGKGIIELGAGTGLVSILAAGPLAAAHVLPTDGLPEVVLSINRNIHLNSDLIHQNSPASSSSASSPSPRLQLPTAKLLDWTDLSELSSVLKPDTKYHTVLGADITYNTDLMEPLVSTFSALESLFPGIDIVIAGAIRNYHTFESFIQTCTAHNFRVEDVAFECLPFHQQKGFFHTIALPIRIVRVVRNA